VAEEFRSSVNTEDLYATVVPKSQRTSAYTDDGFVINKETDLDTVDHSAYKADDEDGSEYVFDMTTGEKVKRSKKVSFAENDEQFEIERESQVKNLGLSKLFGFGPPKPMKSLPGKKADKSDTLEVPAPAAQTRTSPRRSTSKEPSPMLTPNDAASPKSFLSAMTGGLIGSKSPDLGRRDGPGSVFGSLLRKGRKSSRSGSRTSSAERGSQDLGSEDYQDGSLIRTSSRGSNYDDDDARSDSSFAQKLGIKKKKKPPKVAVADFDELFARGMAMSAQIESQNNTDPFKPDVTPGTVSETLKESAGTERFDENGALASRRLKCTVMRKPSGNPRKVKASGSLRRCSPTLTTRPTRLVPALTLTT